MHSPTRRFSLVTVLELALNRLLSTDVSQRCRNIDKVMEFLGIENFIICQQVILDQYPQLDEINLKTLNEATWLIWLDEQIKEFGKTLVITGPEVPDLYDLPVIALEDDGSPTCYQLYKNDDQRSLVTIQRWTRLGEPYWVIEEHRCLLNKRGEWRQIPLPSSRDYRYVRLNYFRSAQKALDFWNKGHYRSRFASQK